MNFKKNKLIQIMKKRQREKQELKKINFDPLIEAVNKKRKPSIKPNELPF